MGCNEKLRNIYHNHPVDKPYYQGDWDMIGVDQRETENKPCLACKCGKEVKK